MATSKGNFRACVSGACRDRGGIAVPLCRKLFEGKAEYSRTHFERFAAQWLRQCGVGSTRRIVEQSEEGAAMGRIHCRRWLVQVGVVAMLACTGVARADSCAGGTDATGNDCTGQQAAPGLSEAQSHALYLQGQAALAELRVARAKQRLMEAEAAFKAAEDAVKFEEAELKTARMAMQVDEQREHKLLAARAPRGN